MTTFYGINDVAEMKKAIQAVETLYAIYNKHGSGTFFFGDNMVALNRQIEFGRDEKFMAAVKHHAEDYRDWAKIWRLHVYCWACRSALSLPGDLMECGVYRGLYSAVMAEALDFANSGRTLYLYDTFEGLPVNSSTEYERRNTASGYDFTGAFEFVTTRFAPYPNARIVRGIVPDSFAEAVPDRIAFLHVDMNAAQAEIAAVDYLFDRLVPGAIVLLDDYGRQENGDVHKAHSAWFASRGYQILELPTGQGMVIRH